MIHNKSLTIVTAIEHQASPQTSLFSLYKTEVWYNNSKTTDES